MKYKIEASVSYLTRAVYILITHNIQKMLALIASVIN